jgi:arylsulfatase A-like enzyme
MDCLLDASLSIALQNFRTYIFVHLFKPAIIVMKEPHVVVICLDTVRKDFYDKYAQQLTNLATHRFHEMRAPSSWSVPSHAAMFSGELPHETGIHTYSRDFGNLDIEQTFLADFDMYRTVAISANTFASSAFGFDSLFDQCISISPSSRFPNGLDVNDFVRNYDREGVAVFLNRALNHSHPLKSVANAILFKLYEATQGRKITQPFDFGGKAIARGVRNELCSATDPTFIFANFMDAHSPHTLFRDLKDTTIDKVPSSFTSLDLDYEEINADSELNGHETEIEYVRQLYGGSIAYLDNVVANLVTSVQETIDRETVFVITSDHGENLGYPDDDWLIGHGDSLSEGLLHVPFDIISDTHYGETNTRTSLLDLGTIIGRLRDGRTLPDFDNSVVLAEVAGPSGDSPDGQKNGRAIRAAYVQYFTKPLS